jgi:hypothetical protein
MTHESGTRVVNTLTNGVGHRRRALRALATACAAVLASSVVTLSWASAHSTPASVSTAHPASSAASVQTASALPAQTCALSGTTRSCALWAKAGTLQLPAGASPASVDIWGYADAAGSPPSVPGPLIVANVGETLEITLTNLLDDPTSLALPGWGLVPDTSGIPNGGSRTYTVDLDRPGTFRYEPGLTALGPLQGAMGLQGVIVVRPGTSGRAYEGAASSFDDEAVAVVSTVDPAFSADPMNVALEDYVPTFWLLNGQGFPETDPITSEAGHDVLVRYVNATLAPISMGVLGIHQTIVGREGREDSFPHDVVAETLPAGTTLDTVTSLPSGAAPGTTWAVYEASGRIDNGGHRTAGIVDFGGALTFIQALAASGPVTSSITVVPDRTDGSGSVSVTAGISDELTGSDSVTQAEYFLDTAGADGSGTAMTLDPATGTTVEATADVPVSGLDDGVHTVLVHGRDDTGAWGALASGSFRVDATGPQTTVALDPNPVDGTTDVTITATADDSSNGGATVTDAEAYVDAPCPGVSPTSMSLDGAAGVTSVFTATVAAGLSEGEHAVRVRSQDDLGNWGACTEATLTVDRTGAVASGAQASPGTVAATSPVTLTATTTDPTSAGVHSTVAAAEWSVDAVATPGNGDAMAAADGSFDEASEDVTATVNVSTLPAGPHTLWVRARDSVGNWGDPTSTTVTILPSDTVFADGFESGDLGAWSGSSGGSSRISVQAEAAIIGSYGLRAVISGNTPSYVRDESPSGETSAHARFWFDPNGTDTTDLATSILVGESGNGSAIFRVEYRTSAGEQQVRGSVQKRRGAAATTAWLTVSDAPHAIEVAWESAANAEFRLYLDGSLRETLSGLDTGKWTLERTLLGPSAGLKQGPSGTEYFDGYVMTRSTLIGP